MHFGVNAQYVLHGHAAVCRRLQGHCNPRPWGLTPNGDLWDLWERALANRGTHSYRLTNVKSHATDEAVQEGHCRQLDKAGNGAADAMASAEAKRHRDD